LPAGWDGVISAYLEEYKTLRDESFHARTAHQAVLQWSLAAYAVIFAGGLTYLRGSNADQLPIALVIFGMGLPGFLLVSSMSWYGELRGMARAASYLRKKEMAFQRYVEAMHRRDATQHLQRVDTELLELATMLSPKFETALARDETRIWATYAGPFSIYIGGTLISLLTFVYFLLSADFGKMRIAIFRTHSYAWKTTGICYATSLWVAYVGVFSWACWRQRAAGKDLQIPIV